MSSTRPEPGDGFFWTEAPAGPALACGPMAAAAAHLFTTRGWALGSPNPPDDAAWDEVALGMGVDRAHLVRVRQVHGAGLVVRRAGAPPAPAAALAEADIIVSDDPSLALAIQAADCVPLLLADPVTGAVAAAHAGWRGLAAGVPRVAVDALAREFGAAPSDLVAAVGPSISAARYEVGGDVRARFEAGGFGAEAIDRWFAASRPDHWFFDGWRAARDGLLAAGVAADRIYLAGLCTASHGEWLCSYRRDRGAAGRIAAAIRPLAR